MIVSALRTPITRAKKGGLKDTPADDLLATLLKATVDRTGLNPEDVGDVVVGSVLGNSSQRANECRIAMFLAGFPQEVPVRTVNRQCSSGKHKQERELLERGPSGGVLAFGGERGRRERYNVNGAKKGGGEILSYGVH